MAAGAGRRWVVERTFAWISKHRRTVCDYEHRPVYQTLTESTRLGRPDYTTETYRADSAGARPSRPASRPR